MNAIRIETWCPQMTPINADEPLQLCSLWPKLSLFPIGVNLRDLRATFPLGLLLFFGGTSS